MNVVPVVFPPKAGLAASPAVQIFPCVRVRAPQQAGEGDVQVRLMAGGRTRLADIAVSGLPGWITVNTSDGRGSVRLGIWAPAGVEVFVRPPMPVGPSESARVPKDPPRDPDGRDPGGWWFDGLDARSSFEAAGARRTYSDWPSVEGPSRERRGGRGDPQEDWWGFEEGQRAAVRDDDFVVPQGPKGTGRPAWETSVDQEWMSPRGGGQASSGKGSWETQRKQRRRGSPRDDQSRDYH